MKEKAFLNRMTVSGYIFNLEGSRDWDKLQKRISGENSKNPGQEYVSGVISIATDSEALNVVQVHFTYVTPEWGKSGKKNQNYDFLVDLIERNENGTLKTFEKCGTDAEKITVTGDISLNEFVDQEDNFVAVKQIRGSFIGNMTARDTMGAFFDCEALISNAAIREVEDGEDYMTISGYVFNFRKELLPVQFTVRIPGGINFFEGREVSSKNPFLGKISGEVVSSIVSVARDDSEADGFGEVKPTTRTIRSWDISSARETMEFDDEDTLTLGELKKLISDRADHEAEIRKQQEERKAARGDGFDSPKKKAVVETSDDDDEDFDF